jgi:Ca2+-binding RTX toxin-like protein
MRANFSGIVEALESRQLLSGAVLSHGFLRVFGDGASTNTITVRNSADNLNVDVVITSVNSAGQSKLFTKSFAKALGISSVWIRGGAKDDTITVSEQNGLFTIPARVLSLGGNDNVTTASGNDIIFAGAGNDTVHAGNGIDWVRGMVGDDSLFGDGGNDRVNAGPGNDLVDGGGGSDMLRGEVGNDSLVGGSGDDLVYGGFGNDVITGDSGNDALWGCAGDDNIDGGSGNDTVGGFLGTNALTGGNGQDTFVVRQLTLQNPSNDYDALEDILLVVTKLNEGGKPPVA